MSAVNLIFGICCTITIAIAIYGAVVNRRHLKQNINVADELDRLIKAALELAQKGKELEQNRGGMRGASFYGKDGDPADLTTPGMLATLVTVLVHKYGNVRLDLKDFMIKEDEYVSIYVDTKSQELILSLNHSLDAESDYVLANFTDTDDNTFH